MTQFYTQQHQEKIKKLYRTTPWYGNRDQYLFQLEANRSFLLEYFLRELTPKSVLDYGSGNGLATDLLAKSFPKIQFVKFDPFVEKYSIRPTDTFDLVVSHRVLRAVEPQFKESVINDMYNYASKYLLLEILLYDVDGISFDYYDKILSKYNVIKKAVNQPVLRQGSDALDHYVANAGFLVKK